MSSPINTHALIAAFAFGIVANAAPSSVILFLKGHGGNIFQDGPRLLLVIFLCASGLWAFMHFIVMTTQSSSACQVTLSFASAFDQLARVSFEQFLLWASFHGPKLSFSTLLPQGTIVLRFILGGVFVGLQRPQLQPVCLSYTLLLPLGITVLVVDTTLLLLFLIKLNWSRSSEANLLKDQDKNITRDKKLILSTAAFGVWTALSSPMILGIRSFHITLRTVIPAVGLLVLIAVVLFCRNYLVLDIDQETSFTPGGSPPRIHRTTAFVTTNDLSTRQIAPSMHFEDLPGQIWEGKSATVTTSAAHKPSSSLDRQLPTISQPLPGRSSVGMGGLPVAGQLFPPMRSEDQWNSGRAQDVGLRIYRNGPGSSRHEESGLVISHPILDEHSDKNPLNKIPTIDLETAARRDREQRRARHPQPLKSHSVLFDRHSQQIRPVSVDHLRQSLIDAEAHAAQTSGTAVVPSVMLEPIRESASVASSTSAQPSPGVEEMRRRSPYLPMQSSFEPMRYPPPPPLKTPRTVSTSMTLPPNRGQTKSEIWDILAAPGPSSATEGSSVQTSSTSSPRSRPTTSPVARGIGAMTLSSRPNSAGSHSRTQSVSSRKSRSRDVIFTDPRTPPPLPEGCSLAGPETQAQAGNEVSNRHPPSYRRVPSMVTAEQSPMDKPLPARPTRPPTSGTSDPIRNDRLSLFPSISTKPPNRQSNKVAAKFSSSPPRAKAPSKPRSQDDHSKVQEQTIMLLKEIEYSRPIDVNSIVEQYLGKKPPSSPSTVILDSVLNRPRPIPRTPETGRVFNLFGNPPKARDRRSLSCSSINIDKSVLRGISALQPDLPALPSSLTVEQAECMAIEEKMAMLRPRAQSSGSSSTRTTRPRSTSLPGIISPVYNTDKLVRPRRQDDYDKRHSNRSSATTVRTLSLFTLSDQPITAHHTPGPPASASQDSVEEPSQRLTYVEEPQRSLRDIQRQSSPVLPPGNLETSYSMADSPQSFEGPTTFRGSLASVATAIIPTIARADQPSPVSDRDAMQVNAANGPSEAVEEGSEDSCASGSRSSLNFDPSLPPIQTETARTWHRRVGEKCPTFSDRKGVAKPRNAPPPMPLPLGKPGAGRVIVAAEPSPLESPSHALELINAQLKKLEESDRRSVVTEQQRLTLLANLEMEMGMQESQWQMLRRNTVRDSLSTVTSSPYKEDVINGLGLTSIPRLERNSLRSSVAGNRSSRHLSEASRNVESINRRSVLSNAGSGLSFLTVAHSSSQLGSPTPPDTDESDSEEIPLSLDLRGASRPAAPCLWTASVPSPVVVMSCPKLWSPTLERASDPLFDTYIASASPPVQPSSKRVDGLVTLETFQLWRPSPLKPRRSSAALWTPSSTRTPEPGQKAKPRPLSRKPSRRSKRITALPDILESPQPLPNNPGGLGIFQFAWGETSDMAVIPEPTFPGFAMPGTMTSGQPLTGSFFIGYQQDRHLGLGGRMDSFFDDVGEEENAGDNFSDFDEDDEDEDFDESTLWEIASLLQSSQVPSRGSLLPSEWLSGNGLECLSPQSPTTEHEEMVPMILDLSSAPQAVTKPAPRLWVNKTMLYKRPESLGLPQPNSATWTEYLSVAGRDSNPAKRHEADEPASVAGSMWSQPMSRRQSTFAGNRLWNPDVSTEPSTKSASTVHADADIVDGHVLPPQLWTALLGASDAAKSAVEPSSLWSQSHSQRPALFHAAVNDVINRGRRPETSPIPHITSGSLWSPSQRHSATTPRSWIHGGVIMSDMIVPSKTEKRSGRVPATEIEWTAALNQAIAASDMQKTLITASPHSPSRDSEPSLWSDSLAHSRQQSSSPSNHLWTPHLGPIMGGANTLQLPPLSPLPRRKRGNTPAVEETEEVPDILAQRLWNGVEAASRLSRMGKQTDWMAQRFW